MSTKLRFDFPPEVVCERSQLYDRIFDLLAQHTPEAFEEAKELHLNWLERYPNDYVALDAGEVIAMSEEDKDGLEASAFPERVFQATA
jgi:hypothetical protein